METLRRTALAAFFLAIAFPVLAAPVPPPDTEPAEETTPSTAVARLKIVKGTAWVRPADSGEWEEYTHNSPVVERARVSIPEGSEAEVQFRGSQYLLLQGGSEVEVRQLGEGKVSFRLRSGQVAFSLSKDAFAPVAVKLPGNRDVSLDTPGLYWLTIDGGAAKLNVRRGEGTVSGEGMQPVTVKAGEEASINKEVRVSRGKPPAAEPAPETLTEAERKAGVPLAAATELRPYGEWVWTSEYGYVWQPYVAEGWAPYYYGQWAWVYPYGWNWVGYEPWGWWPYHYGWWVSIGAYGWCWAPYHSFHYADAYYYRGHQYPYHYGYYSPGNVRFTNDGRYVRWVPAQPGRGATRTAGFSRSDTRLAQWNRPMPGNTVTSRGARVSATTGGSATSPRLDRSGAVPSSLRGGAGVTGRETIGRSAVQSGSRPFREGGGRVSAVPTGTGAPGRGPASRGSGWSGGGEPRSYGTGRGYANPPARGYDTMPRGYQAAPRGSFDAGYRAFEGATRSIEGSVPRGNPGGTRVFDGGGGSRGVGGSWGGGGGTRGLGGFGGGGVRGR